MRVNEEQRFFHRLHGECEQLIASSADSSVSQLINRVQQAADQGIVSEDSGNKVYKALNPLKERMLSQLTPSEQDLLLKTLLQAGVPPKGRSKG